MTVRCEIIVHIAVTKIIHRKHEALLHPNSYKIVIKNNNITVTSEPKKRDRTPLPQKVLGKYNLPHT